MDGRAGAIHPSILKMDGWTDGMDGWAIHFSSIHFSSILVHPSIHFCPSTGMDGWMSPSIHPSIGKMDGWMDGRREWMGGWMEWMAMDGWAIHFSSIHFSSILVHPSIHFRPSTGMDGWTGPAIHPSIHPFSGWMDGWRQLVHPSIHSGKCWVGGWIDVLEWETIFLEREAFGFIECPSPLWVMWFRFYRAKPFAREKWRHVGNALHAVEPPWVRRLAENQSPIDGFYSSEKLRFPSLRTFLTASTARGSCTLPAVEAVYDLMRIQIRCLKSMNIMTRIDGN